VREVAERTDVPLATRVAVFVRDCWTCRYCGATTIAPPVLRVLSRLYPRAVPVPPNWKAGQVHPAYMLASTSLDHLVAGARDGSWTDPDNLMTACSPCNTAKSDLTLEELGWTVLDEAAIRSDWDGLTGHYRALWERAGQPDAGYHRDWLRALDRTHGR
jgi:5-methylcytosine-specific restriction endonuclease McrA